MNVVEGGKRDDRQEFKITLIPYPFLDRTDYAQCMGEFIRIKAIKGMNSCFLQRSTFGDDIHFFECTKKCRKNARIKELTRLIPLYIFHKFSASLFQTAFIRLKPLLKER